MGVRILRRRLRGRKPRVDRHVSPWGVRIVAGLFLIVGIVLRSSRSSVQGRVGSVDGRLASSV